MRFALLLALGLAASTSVVGCADESAEPTSQSDDVTSTTSAVADGSPEGVGVLRLLADPGTTLAILDVSVGLDARAAKNLVAHRDGADGVRGTKDDNAFDTIGEVQAIPYVATTAMNKLVAYAAAHDFTPEGDELLGTYEGVAFSVNQATAALALVNTANESTLDYTVGLDVRAVRDIIRARPLSTVLALSQVANVGPATLTKIAAYTGGVTGAAEVAALTPEVEGLLYPSESDRPFEPVLVAGAGTTPITAENIKARIASVYVQDPDDTLLADRVVETKSLDDEFSRFLSPQDWWEQSNYDAQPRYQAIYDTLKGLRDVKVYRLGHRYPGSHYLDGAIDLYIVGESSDGALVGLHTVSVET